MRNPRQHQVDVALAESYSAAAGFLVPDSILKADAARRLVPRAAESELVEALRLHDTAGRLTTVQGPVEAKRKLNDAGQAWLEENR